MTNNIKYNVGAIKIGSDYKQIYSASSDGTPFLCMVTRTTANNVTTAVVRYLPTDYVKSMMVLGLAVLSAQVNLADYENTKAPLYTTQATDGGQRTVTIANLNDSVTDNYTGAPYFSVAGEGISDYTTIADTSNVIYSNASAMGLAQQGLFGSTTSQGVAAPVTGIGFIDEILAFIQSNIILVAILVGALLYFDPFHWFKKKGKKGKG